MKNIFWFYRLVILIILCTLINFNADIYGQESNIETDSNINFSPQASPNEPAADNTVDETIVIEGGAGVPITTDLRFSEKKYVGEKISLDFQRADIHNILRLIGEISGYNIVISDNIQGKVTLRLKNVPWDQALDIILSSQKLDYVASGNVIRIATYAEIREELARVSSSNEDSPLIKRILTPKYASVSTLSDILSKATTKRGSVKIIGNDLYIEDDEATVEALDAIFRKNDKVARQIMIEARIIEATASFTQRIGVKWGGVTRNKNAVLHSMATEEGKIVNTPGMIPNYELGDSLAGGGRYTGFDIAESGLKLGTGILNKSGTLFLRAEIDASESLGETKILTSPRILAANDQEVFIKQGTQIPYQSGATATTAATTEFKEAVMQLKVKPHIEENGEIITLDIVVNKDSPGMAVIDGNIPIETKEAKTKLMVRDGETVVIGGIISDTQAPSSNGVPGLQRIPLLGWLFRSTETRDTKSELLIFITANIVPITI